MSRRGMSMNAILETMRAHPDDIRLQTASIETLESFVGVASPDSVCFKDEDLEVLVTAMSQAGHTNLINGVFKVLGQVVQHEPEIFDRMLAIDGAVPVFRTALDEVEKEHEEERKEKAVEKERALSRGSSGTTVDDSCLVQGMGLAGSGMSQGGGPFNGGRGGDETESGFAAAGIRRWGGDRDYVSSGGNSHSEGDVAAGQTASGGIGTKASRASLRNSRQKGGGSGSGAGGSTTPRQKGGASSSATAGGVRSMSSAASGLGSPSKTSGKSGVAGGGKKGKGGAASSKNGGAGRGGRDAQEAARSNSPASQLADRSAEVWSSCADPATKSFFQDSEPEDDGFSSGSGEDNAGGLSNSEGGGGRRGGGGGGGIDGSDSAAASNAAGAGSRNGGGANSRSLRSGGFGGADFLLGPKPKSGAVTPAAIPTDCQYNSVCLDKGTYDLNALLAGVGTGANPRWKAEKRAPAATGIAECPSLPPCPIPRALRNPDVPSPSDGALFNEDARSVPLPFHDEGKGITMEMVQHDQRRLAEASEAQAAAAQRNALSGALFEVTAGGGGETPQSHTTPHHHHHPDEIVYEFSWAPFALPVPGDPLSAAPADGSHRYSNPKHADETVEYGHTFNRRKEGDSCGLRTSPKSAAAASSGGGVSCAGVSQEAWHKDTLSFDSFFESGNLKRAIKVSDYEYDLVLKKDYNTKGNFQWFLFACSGARAGCRYKFNIVNLAKPDSLYNHGLKPLMYHRKTGYQRAGDSVCYYKNHHYRSSKGAGRRCYTLTWSVVLVDECDSEELLDGTGTAGPFYFAHCYPYTYTHLQEYLAGVELDKKRAAVTHRTVLCPTVAGNRCELLVVTSPSRVQHTMQNPHSKNGVLREALVVSARVHPGETNASWIMEGFIDFVTGSTPEAEAMREKYVIFVIPMLNPDGVICGNYRCSLAGIDLNRQWAECSREFMPTIYHLKRLMRQWGVGDGAKGGGAGGTSGAGGGGPGLNLGHDKYLRHKGSVVDVRGRKVSLYVDLHGHSRKENCFVYGCNTPGMEERVIPYLLWEKGGRRCGYSYRDCSFSVQASKAGTGRIYTMQKLLVPNSFTLEVSFAGGKLSRFCGLTDDQIRERCYMEQRQRMIGVAEKAAAGGGEGDKGGGGGSSAKPPCCSSMPGPGESGYNISVAKFDVPPEHTQSVHFNTWHLKEMGVVLGEAVSQYTTSLTASRKSEILSTVRDWAEHDKAGSSSDGSDADPEEDLKPMPSLKRQWEETSVVTGGGGGGGDAANSENTSDVEDGSGGSDGAAGTGAVLLQTFKEKKKKAGGEKKKRKSKGGARKSLGASGAGDGNSKGSAGEGGRRGRRDVANGASNDSRGGSSSSAENDSDEQQAHGGGGAVFGNLLTPNPSPVLSSTQLLMPDLGSLEGLGGSNPGAKLNASVFKGGSKKGRGAGGNGGSASSMQRRAMATNANGLPHGGQSSQSSDAAVFRDDWDDTPSGAGGRVTIATKTAKLGSDRGAGAKSGRWGEPGFEGQEEGLDASADFPVSALEQHEANMLERQRQANSNKATHLVSRLINGSDGQRRHDTAADAADHSSLHGTTSSPPPNTSSQGGAGLANAYHSALNGRGPPRVIRSPPRPPPPVVNTQPGVNDGVGEGEDGAGGAVGSRKHSSSSSSPSCDSQLHPKSAGSGSSRPTASPAFTTAPATMVACTSPHAERIRSATRGRKTMSTNSVGLLPSKADKAQSQYVQKALIDRTPNAGNVSSASAAAAAAAGAAPVSEKGGGGGGSCKHQHGGGGDSGSSLGNSNNNVAVPFTTSSLSKPPLLAAGGAHGQGQATSGSSKQSFGSIASSGSAASGVGSVQRGVGGESPSPSVPPPSNRTSDQSVNTRWDQYNEARDAERVAAAAGSSPGGHAHSLSGSLPIPPTLQQRHPPPLKGTTPNLTDPTEAGPGGKEAAQGSGPVAEMMNAWWSNLNQFEESTLEQVAYQQKQQQQQSGGSSRAFTEDDLQAAAQRQEALERELASQEQRGVPTLSMSTSLAHALATPASAKSPVTAAAVEISNGRRRSSKTGASLLGDQRPPTVPNPSPTVSGGHAAESGIRKMSRGNNSNNASSVDPPAGDHASHSAAGRGGRQRHQQLDGHTPSSAGGRFSPMGGKPIDLSPSPDDLQPLSILTVNGMLQTQAGRGQGSQSISSSSSGPAAADLTSSSSPSSPTRSIRHGSNFRTAAVPGGKSALNLPLASHDHTEKTTRVENFPSNFSIAGSSVQGGGEAYPPQYPRGNDGGLRSPNQAEGGVGRTVSSPDHQPYTSHGGQGSRGGGQERQATATGLRGSHYDAEPSAARLPKSRSSPFLVESVMAGDDMMSLNSNNVADLFRLSSGGFHQNQNGASPGGRSPASPASDRAVRDRAGDHSGEERPRHALASARWVVDDDLKPFPLSNYPKKSFEDGSVTDAGGAAALRRIAQHSNTRAGPHALDVDGGLVRELLDSVITPYSGTGGTGGMIGSHTLGGQGGQGDTSSPTFQNSLAGSHAGYNQAASPTGRRERSAGSRVVNNTSADGGDNFSRFGRALMSPAPGSAGSRDKKLGRNLVRK